MNALTNNRGTSMHLGLVCFVSSIVSAVYSAISAARNPEDLLTTCQYLSALGLSATLLFLPSLLSKYVSKKIGKATWFSTDGAITLFSLALCFILGMALPSGTLRWPLILSGSILFVLALRSTQNKSTLPGLLATATFTSIFLVTLFYAQAYHSPVFTEKVIHGQANVDTLYHSAISNLYKTYHTITSGVHGTPRLKYHIGSHVLFAGLSNLTGLSSIRFYNVVYPIVFMPLFLKACLLFTSALVGKEPKHSLFIPFLFIILTICYSTGYACLDNMQPLISESNAVGITLAFLFISILPSISNSERMMSRVSFIAFAQLMVIWITLSKLSVGLVFSGTMGYLLLRSRGFRPHIIGVLAVTLAAWVLCVYYVAYDSNRMAAPQDLLTRYTNMWLPSGGMLGYALASFIACLLIAKRVGASESKSVFRLIKTARLLDCELLLIATGLGLIGAAVASKHASDSAYFGMVQFFPGILIGSVFLYDYIEKYLVTRKVAIASVLVATSALISTPGIQKSFMEIREAHKAWEQGDNLNQRLTRELIRELKEINGEKGKDRLFIYIPFDQQWFYSVRRTQPYSVFFIAQAYSGVAMLAGVPQQIKELSRYSFQIYKDAPLPYDLNRARSEALNKGAERLIVFYANEDELVRQDIPLGVIRN